MFLPWHLRCYRFLYTYRRSYCNICLGGVSSGKGLYFNACLYVSPFLHPKVAVARIKEWRLITNSWLLCSPVDCVPHLNYRLIAEVYVGNFQIRYRTGSSRFFHLHKSTEIILGRMEGQGTERWMSQWRCSWVSKEL